MSAIPPAGRDPATVRRWLQQHLLLGLLQLAVAVAALFSWVLDGSTDPARVSPLTWLLLAVLVAVSIWRYERWFRRGRPGWQWLEGRDDVKRDA